MTDMMMCVVCFIMGGVCHKAAQAMWGKIKAYALAEVAKLANVIPPVVKPPEPPVV